MTLASYYILFNNLMSHFFLFLLHFEVKCYTCKLFYICKHFTYFYLQTKYEDNWII